MTWGDPDVPGSMNQGWTSDVQRRLFLRGLTAAGFASLFRPAAAQPADTPGEAFLNVSKLLTGRTSLDAQQSARLYEALAADSPRFEADIRALLATIADRHLDAAENHDRLVHRGGRRGWSST